MDKLVIIGANDFQNQLILKAKSLGYETHVFAWESGDIGEKTADYFYPISIVEKEKILEVCKKIKPKGICSIASDLATITVNYVSERLGLNGNPYSITEQCTNKYEMRSTFLKNGIRTPKFVKVSDTNDLCDLDNFSFPIIVKPTDRSGSRSITKIYEKNELPSAIERAVKDSFESKAIIEEFIDGDEYSCECISYKGEHNFLAFTKKYTTGAPGFIETGHSQPSDIAEDVQSRVKDEVFKALTALGVQNGASHSEFKIDKQGNCRIIEIGARMGGDCIGSDLVMLSTGFDFMKMVIDVACGKKPLFEHVVSPRCAKITFIFNHEDLGVFESIKERHPDKIFRISEFNISNIDNVKDSSTRVGYYITVE